MSDRVLREIEKIQEATEITRLREANKKLLSIAKAQGVNLDIIAFVDEIAEDCPKWAGVLHSLKDRAKQNNEDAKNAISKVNGE